MPSSIAVTSALTDTRFKQIADSMIEIFWEAYREAFPEVTSGDSQMCSEPVSGMAAWLTRATGYSLLTDQNIDYTMPLDSASGFLPLPEHAPEDLEERVTRMVTEGLNRAATFVGRQIGIKMVAPDDVASHMRGCINDVLYWNYPRTTESAAQV